MQQKKRGRPKGWRKEITVKDCEKIIKKFSALVKKKKDERKLCHAAYDHNLAQIRKCEKRSEQHKMLLFIEDMLNKRSMVIPQEIAVFSSRIEKYRNIKAELS